MATVRLHRERWVADYNDQYGRRHRERPQGPFANKAQERRAAQRLLERRLAEIERGTYSVDNARITFAEAFALFMASKLSIRSTTRRSYVSLFGCYLDPCVGDKPVQQLSAFDIERLRNDLMAGRPPPVEEAFARRLMQERPGLSRARAKQRASKVKPGLRTISKCLTLLSMVLNFCCRRRLIDHNPAAHIEHPRAKPTLDADIIDANVLSPAEVKRLIDAAEPVRRDARGAIATPNYRLMISTAVHTGLRSGELRGLKWGDIDWNARQVFVRRSYKEREFREPKTQASIRRVDIPTNLLNELREWRLACPKGDLDLVFPNAVGNPVSNANMLQRGFYVALRKAGLRRIRMHDLRHTYASLMILAGQDIVRISRQMGHSSPVVTMKIYSHQIPQQSYEGADLLEAMINGPSAESRT